MRASLRQTAVVTAAMIGLAAMAVADLASAQTSAPAGAPTGAKDPAAVSPTVPPSGPKVNQAPAELRETMTAKIEERIADLHGKLQITAAQEPQWKRFADVMRENARKMDQTFESRIQSLPNMTASDNMRSYARISLQHARDVQNLVPAFDTLYAAMSDTQKHTADQVFRADSYRGGDAKHG
jgi:hypothetical protein